MPKKEYDWADGEPPLIATHSLAKHRILREYVTRYVEVLTARVGQETLRVTFVDGFAGGGEYQHCATRELCPGSPLILLDAVRDAETIVNARRRKPVQVDAHFIFVEKEPEVHGYLKDLLTKRGDFSRNETRIKLICGTFESTLDAILADIKQRTRARRVVFVLDQYGYTGVPLTSLHRIFSELPNAEVFLTIAVGWMTAYLPNARVAAQKLGFPVDVIDRVCAPSCELMDTDDATRRFDMFAVQRLLHDAFTTSSGARFYTPFFITSRDSNRPYWFLHLANSVRATDVVKELHWSINNHFEHFGKAGLLMLGFDPREGVDRQRQTSFYFDPPASALVREHLMIELPSRLRTDHPFGLSFEQLYGNLSNETTATKQQLSTAICALCVEGDLQKVGANGEHRAPGTLPHADDLVSVSRQRKLFPQ